MLQSIGFQQTANIRTLLFETIRIADSSKIILS
jgi:hypothetical protein